MTDKELIAAYLKDHQVVRKKMRARTPATWKQFGGLGQRGVRRVYAEVLKDHRREESDESVLSADDLRQHDPEMPQSKES